MDNPFRDEYGNPLPGRAGEAAGWDAQAQQVADGSRRVAELAQALREAREDAMWFLRGESGLPFDPDPHACLREIAKTCDAALEGPQ